MNALEIRIPEVACLAAALSAGERFPLGIKESVKNDVFRILPRYLDRFHNIQ